MSARIVNRIYTDLNLVISLKDLKSINKYVILHLNKIAPFTTIDYKDTRSNEFLKDIYNSVIIKESAILFKSINNEFSTLEGSKDDSFIFIKSELYLGSGSNYYNNRWYKFVHVKQ